MNVPWNNLYTDPVIADIDGVYIVAGPAAGTFEVAGMYVVMLVAWIYMELNYEFVMVVAI